MGQNSNGGGRRTGNEREHVAHHIHVQSVLADYNVCILQVQTMVDGGSGGSSVTEQYFLQAD